MDLSRRAQALHESATLAVSSRAKQLRHDGVDIVDWSAGEPDFSSPEPAVEAASRALQEGKTRYAPVAGLSELRSALATDFSRRLGAPWQPEDFVVTVGAKAALFELALALCDPGVEVIIPHPCWVTFPEQIRLAGASVIEVPARENEGFRVAARDVIRRFSGNTRVVVLNSPSNPTGAVIGEEDLRRIAEECVKADVFLVCDETYERFVYDGRDFASGVSLAREFPDHVILVGSFSKTHAMTGWRIGYMAGPQMVVNAVKRIQSHSTSNATTFAMWGAFAALEGADERVAEMLGEYQARRDLLVEGLRAIPGIECTVPEGAFYAFPNVSALYDSGVSGSTAFAELLLEEARVAVVPGIAFGADGNIRISFACSRDRIQKGLARITQLLSRR